MRSILEFALFAWVGISLIAVAIQLIRIARYKRDNRGAQVEPPTTTHTTLPINLDERLNVGDKRTSGEPLVDTSAVGSSGVDSTAVDSTAVDSAGARAAASHAPVAPPMAGATAAASPPRESINTSVPPVAPPPVQASVPTTPAPTPPAPSTVTASTPAVRAQPATSSPTLADLLAGVRLPWNLLPTVDQSRQPSNDRVALITHEGEPADIGVDVADELERLGFSIAPRGDDTAIATRDGRSLGLQIIPDPMTAEFNGTPRFPSATDASVALDIWVE